MTESLSMWVMYKHPPDYPNSYVGREWIGDEWTLAIIIMPTFEKLNEAINIAYGKDTFIPPDESDDPCIIGTWI